MCFPGSDSEAFRRANEPRIESGIARHYRSRLAFRQRMSLRRDGDRSGRFKDAMSEEQFDRVQHLFLTALELAEEQRASWLIEQCGDDQALLHEVRSLLEHDSPAADPLEKPLDQVIRDVDRTMLGSDPNRDTDGEEESACAEEDEFFSRLAEAGILSSDEISAIERDASGDDPSSDPRLLASQLVTDGKLTEYQASALLKGQPDLLIDKYLILDLIDTGGMGTVFKAIHRPMNRVVAIKMISKHLLASQEQVQRFLREVRVAATLENVNVVRAYDADRFKGVHFLVMEYVRGENLAKIVRRDGPMTVEASIDCIRQAANGLCYAHGRGIVHRDIKPGNLMRTDDQLVKVLDLGLADVDESFRLVQERTIVSGTSTATNEFVERDLTEIGALLGTASFMAPEQSRDAGSADPRSDIYSLGCTLYYLLVGEPPYKAETSVQVLSQHRESEVPSIRTERPDVPQSVDSIGRRMLAKDPDDRFQSMGELLVAIEDCEIDRSPQTSGRSSSRLSHLGRGSIDLATGRYRGRRLRAFIAAVLAATVFAVGLIGFGFWMMPNSPRDQATPPRGFVRDDPTTTPLPLSANGRHQQYTPERTSFNPHEREIGPSSVSRLGVRWKNRHRSTIRWGVCVVGDIAYYGDYGSEFRAVDVATGKTVWTQKLDGKHQGHVIVDQVAYVTSIHRLFAFDALTGKTLWTRLPPSGRFGGPLVVDEICYVGTDSPPTLRALKTSAGDELWNVPGGSVASTGKEIWNVAGGSIAISDGMIYKSLERTLQALDATTGATQWQVTIPEGRLTGPVVSDGVVYVNSSAGKLYAYDVTDRQMQDRSPIWVGEMQHTDGGGPQQTDGDGPQTPAVGHGKVFVGVDNRFYAFDVTARGEFERLPLWERQVETPFFSASAPVVANGVVYSTAGYHDLFAFDVLDGELLWDFHTQGREFPMRSTPTIANGQLYHSATFDFTLYAFGFPKRSVP